MEAFGLGPLPFGWECKIEPKLGRIYFLNHQKQNTQWMDPRLEGIATPPYQLAITQPTAYFEDTSGSRWSSPVPSLRGFSLHRRGSSPRLGGSPRIAPSPTPPPKNKRNEQSIVLESSSSASGQRGGGASSSCSHQYHHSSHNDVQLSSSTPARAATATSNISVNLGTSVQEPPPHHHHHQGGQPNERPQSARSFSSSSYCGVPSSFLAACDTETAFRTVCCLFPTAGEPQIRHLFHKYHNRANLVLSALQVAKHPLASEIANQLELSAAQKLGIDGKDGDTDTIITSILGDSKSMGMNSPLKMNSYGTETPRTGTPVSLLKFSNNQSSVGSLFTRYGSPQLSMSPQLNLVRSEASSSSKPPKSPKMKLKYLKGIFPAADETFLLDVLSSCENNVQKASDKLLRKGFSRTPPSKPARHKWFEVKTLIEKRQKAINQTTMANVYHQAMGEPLETPFPTPVSKTKVQHLTAVEKSKNRDELIKKFPNLPERFINWALEASTFEKEKAERLLQEVGPQTPEEFKPFLIAGAVMPEGHTGKSEKESSSEGKKISFAETVEEVIETCISPSSVESGDSNKVTPSSDENENVDTPDSGYFELDNSKTRKKSFISNLFNLKGSEKDAKNYTGASSLAKGHNTSLARGPNPELIQSHYIQTMGESALQVKGPNPALRTGPRQTPHGPNASLAKGSMWSNNKAKAIHHKDSSNNNNNNSIKNRPQLATSY